MKREALNHPKMLDLASRLDISRAQTIGIVTLLFDFTATYATQGDIGKHRDGAIARACDWNGPPDEFVTALVDSGWLDRHDECRLVIHDWAEHCENWVRAKLAKAKLPFAGRVEAVVPSTDSSYEHSYGRTYEGPSEASPSRDLASPSLAKPSQTKPSPASPSPASPSPAQPGQGHTAVPVADAAAAEAAIFGLIDRMDRDEAARQATRLHKAAPSLDPSFVWELAVISQAIKPGFVSEITTGIRTGEIRKPRAYIETAFRGVCEELGVSLSKLRGRVPPFKVRQHAEASS